MNTTSNFIVYNASAGSGKTYTLVKKYLSIILQSNDAYLFQKVLAITFTNKASNEMKERVMDALELFSDSDKAKNDTMFNEVKELLQIDGKILAKKSKKVLDAILNNYTAFHITTIDSFTHKIIRNFAFDLGLNVDFEVELDQKLVLDQSVEMFMDKIGVDKQITDVLITFALQKIADDKSWDISRELKEFAKLLFNEDDRNHLTKLQHISLEEFSKLKKKLIKDNLAFENYLIEIGKKGLEIVNNTGLEFNYFSNSDLPNHFKKLLSKNIKTLNFNGRLNTNIEKNHHQTAGKANVEQKKIIASVLDDLVSLYQMSKQYYQENYKRYLLHKNVIYSLIPLAVLKKIQEEVNSYKEDNNILLNAEFNGIISEHLTNQPAEFIYEKIGEKYRHFFIDEMQDTSELQWQNLIPLLKNALESLDVNQNTGSLLLVGDAKQSIYRWRGGKAEQFIDLTQDVNPFFVAKDVLNLETNHRSYSNIIKFNNEFFTFLSNKFNNQIYSQLYKTGNNQKTTAKEGGYVSIEFIESGIKVEQQHIIYGDKIVETVKQLDVEFDRNEICVLVRTKKQGVAIAEHLIKNDIAVVSSETLLLKNSLKVNFIVNVFKVLENENDQETKLEILKFLHDYYSLTIDKHLFFVNYVKLDNATFFKQINEIGCTFNFFKLNQLSLYQKAEHILSAINMQEQINAYVIYFLDELFALENKGKNSISQFLEYWELKQEDLSIIAPEQKNAVQIYTIHKSKGLEFPIVIFPYDLDVYNLRNDSIWYNPLPKEYHPLSTTLFNAKQEIADLSENGFELYHKLLKEKELDNYNILYVALTRAKEQLYIFSEHTKHQDEVKKYSHLFMEFLGITYSSSIDHYPLYDSNKRVSDRPKTKEGVKILESVVSTDFNNQPFDLVASKKKKLDSERQNAREYGTIIHEMMQFIGDVTDVFYVVSKFVYEKIVDEKDKKWVEEMLTNIVNNKDLQIYFVKDVHYINEREIIYEGEIIIPDRLVFKDKDVTIIDYKTGKQEKEYHKQLKKYENVLNHLGYQVSKKLLVYINEQIEVVEVI